MPRRRPNKRRRRQTNGMIYREASLFRAGPAGVISIKGDTLKMPACILRPFRLNVKVMSESGVGAVQVRIFDGANNECAISPTHLVSPSVQTSISLHWPSSNDPLPLSWDRQNTLFSITNICSEKSSSATLTGIAEVEVKYEYTEQPSTCPSIWLTDDQFPPPEPGSGVNKI